MCSSDLAAILLWLLELFEALAAMPIVAIAHLTPSGEGLSGAAAKQAYRLWIALLARPVLGDLRAIRIRPPSSRISADFCGCNLSLGLTSSLELT